MPDLREIAIIRPNERIVNPVLELSNDLSKWVNTDCEVVRRTDCVAELVVLPVKVLLVSES